MSTPTPGAPTQVRYSARAVVRTVLQVGIPAFLTLALVVPQIVDVVLEQLGESAPDWLRGALLGVAAVVTATAAVIARVMAIPQVEAFLRSSRFLKWLAAEPRPVPPVDVDHGAAVQADPEAPSAGVPPTAPGTVQGLVDDALAQPYSSDQKSRAAHHDGTAR